MVTEICECGVEWCWRWAWELSRDLVGMKRFWLCAEFTSE